MKFLRKPFLRIYQEESAQAVILCAIVVPVLLGFAAIAIDIGLLRYQQEQLQSAADAAAIAGALEISYCSTANCGAMTTAAVQSMAENGYSNVTLNTQCGSTASATGVTLTVNNGPCELASDPNAGNTGYVEAVVTKSQPTYFARIFNISSETLSARAEAARGPSPYCIYLSTNNTSSSAGTAFLVNGSGTLSASCGIIDDSGGSPAFTVNGSGKVETTRNDVHGGKLLNGTPTVTPSVNTGVPALPDPLSYLKPPSAGSCTSQSQTINGGGGTTTVQPGTFCSGLTINGSVTVTFAPGVYYMKGPLIINGGDNVSGNGVMFYFSSGSLTMNGSSHANFVAPTTSDTTTGAEAGILFYQNPKDTTTMIINGDSTSVFQGTMYSIGGQLTINGGGNLAAYTNMDFASMIDNGTSTFNLGNDYSSLPGGDPIKGITAVLSE